MQAFQFPWDQGHASSAGSGFGADSLPGDGTLNLNSGYNKIRNLVYREDGSLRPPFGEDGFGETLGSGAVMVIYWQDGDYVGIDGLGRLFIARDPDIGWKLVPWEGTGDTPVFTAGVYQFCRTAEGSFVFLKVGGEEPAIIVDPYYTGVYRNNYGRTGWYKKKTVANVPKGSGVVAYTFAAGEEPGPVIGGKMYTNKAVREYPSMELIEDRSGFLSYTPSYGGPMVAELSYMPAMDFGGNEVYDPNLRGTYVGIFDGKKIRLRKNDSPGEGGLFEIQVFDYETGDVQEIPLQGWADIPWYHFPAGFLELAEEWSMPGPGEIDGLGMFLPYDPYLHDAVIPVYDDKVLFVYYYWYYTDSDPFHIAAQLWGFDDDGNLTSFMTKKFYVDYNWDEYAWRHPSIYFVGTVRGDYHFMVMDMPSTDHWRYPDEGEGHKVWYAVNSQSWRQVGVDVPLMYPNYQQQDKNVPWSGYMGNYPRFIKIVPVPSIMNFDYLYFMSCSTPPLPDTFNLFQPSAWEEESEEDAPVGIPLPVLAWEPFPVCGNEKVFVAWNDTGEVEDVDGVKCSRYKLYDPWGGLIETKMLDLSFAGDSVSFRMNSDDHDI